MQGGSYNVTNFWVQAIILKTPPWNLSGNRVLTTYFRSRSRFCEIKRPSLSDFHLRTGTGPSFCVTWTRQDSAPGHKSLHPEPPVEMPQVWRLSPRKTAPGSQGDAMKTDNPATSLLGPQNSNYKGPVLV